MLTDIGCPGVRAVDVEVDVLALDPAEISQPLSQTGESSLVVGVILHGFSDKNPDTAQCTRLLGARGRWQQGSRRSSRNELPPLHEASPRRHFIIGGLAVHHRLQKIAH